MKALLIIQLSFMLVGFILLLMAWQRRSKEFSIINISNPFNPMKSKERYSPAGFRFYISGLVLFELGLLCGVIYWWT